MFSEQRLTLSKAFNQNRITCSNQTTPPHGERPPGDSQGPLSTLTQGNCCSLAPYLICILTLPLDIFLATLQSVRTLPII